MSSQDFTKLIEDVDKMVTAASEQFANNGKLENDSIKTLLIASLLEEEFGNGQESN